MDIYLDIASFVLAEAVNFAQHNIFAIKVFAIVIAAALLFYRVGWIPFQFFKKHGIPHPPYHYVVGNFFDLFGNGKALQLEQACMKSMGGIFGYYFGAKPVIIIADPSLAGKVFVEEFSNFHNRNRLVGIKKPMHLGLLFADYPDWRRIRQTISPSFSLGKIKQTMPLVLKSINSLMDIFEQFSLKEETVEVFSCYGRMTMEIILSVAFGLQSDFQVKGDKKVTEEAAKWFHINLANAIIEVIPLPLLLKEAVKKLNTPDPGFFIRLLKPVVEERMKTPSNRKDFLQLLLSENKADGKPKLTEDDIYASSITFLLAGYETTSNALAFTTYLLALHPEIQDRLYNEIKDNVTDLEENSLYEAIQKLGYLDAVLNESLRLYPPAWRTGRLTKEDTTIGGYTISKGTPVLLPIFAIHHSERYWKNPSKFDPERFSPENKGSIHPYSFLPFGHGPRNCIGMRFALFEAKLTLIMLLIKFRVEKTDETEKHPLELNFGITASPKNGVKLKFVKR